jgi:hypothetical protein
MRLLERDAVMPVEKTSLLLPVACRTALFRHITGNGTAHAFISSCHSPRFTGLRVYTPVRLGLLIQTTYGPSATVHGTGIPLVQSMASMTALIVQTRRGTGHQPPWCYFGQPSTSLTGSRQLTATYGRFRATPLRIHGAAHCPIGSINHQPPTINHPLRGLPSILVLPVPGGVVQNTQWYPLATGVFLLHSCWSIPRDRCESRRTSH